MPPQIFVAIGAISAATITAIVAFIGLIIAKENKISDLRQSWIDKLREDIGKFAAHARNLATQYKLVESGTVVAKPDAEVSIENHRLMVSEKYYAIKLRLNLNEEDHKKLSNQLDELYVISESDDRSTKQFEDIEIACDSAIQLSQKILKREWIRVKSGEPIYATTKTIVKWSIIILVFIGICAGLFFIFQYFV